MRIGVNLLSLVPGGIGGLEFYVRRLIDVALRETEICFVLFANPSAAESFRQVAERVEIRVAERDIGTLALERMIVQATLDVWWCPWVDWRPLQPPVPAVVTIPDLQHENLPENFAATELKARQVSYFVAAHLAKRVITFSEFVRDDINRRYRLGVERIRAIPLGVGYDTDGSEPSASLIHEVKERFGSGFLYCPAAAWPHKGHETLFGALRALRSRGHTERLLLTGTRNENDSRLARAIRDSGLERDVDALGMVSHSMVRALYRGCGVVILPSRFEGFGMPVVEAFLEGAPVVCSEAGSLPEVARDAALLVAPGDEVALATAIERILDDRVLRATLVQRGRERAPEYSWKKTVRATIEVFGNATTGSVADSEIARALGPLLSQLREHALEVESLTEESRSGLEALRTVSAESESRLEALRKVTAESEARLEVIEKLTAGRRHSRPSELASVQIVRPAPPAEPNRDVRRMPTIGIVVPSLNQGPYLAEALESLFRQNYPRLEVVVMDGGSTDGSVDVIRRYADRLTHWQSEPDGGQSAAINDGVEHLSSEIIGWLNSDDLHWGRTLWTVADAWLDHPTAGLYIGNGLRLDAETGDFSPFCPRHVALNRRALAEGIDFILQPSTFFARTAWTEVGGLRSDLHYCMDWDIIQRVAARYPAVLIQDFLAASREHDETKTRGGSLSRVFEIARLAQERTGHPVTPGTVHYLLETLLDEIDPAQQDQLRHRIWSAFSENDQWFAREFGNADGFPEQGDTQDRVFLPIARRDRSTRRSPQESRTTPRISIVVPSFNQGEYLGAALESILSQDLPGLELFVLDGGSTDGTLAVIERYASDITRWVSKPDHGPAGAINEGFGWSSGEVLGWLGSDDLLAAEALVEVANAFAEDPDLDMVLGNAVYIDQDTRPFLADHGTHRTALYYGRIQPPERIPMYWSYVHAVPQPTVFFRRRLLERCGGLDESYEFIFDFELFARFAPIAKVRKIERTQAFYRIHHQSKSSDWNDFLVELYRFSRRRWPRFGTREFLSWWRDYLRYFARRRFAAGLRDSRIWPAMVPVALSTLTGIGNPERLCWPAGFWKPRLRPSRRRR